ncbi:MAG TPA: DUF4870 domain-containing protein [Pirellulaceae bacterium]|nr:DUF4870 domain-containing protein [Pirellulaceae bacterium]
MSYGSPYPPAGKPPGPAPGYAAPVGHPGPSGTTDDDRLWAMLSHLAGFIFAIFGPLIIWMVKKDQSEFVVDQAKEALNFQLTVLIVQVILAATCVGILVMPIIMVGQIIYAVLGGMEANKGIRYRYPYTFRMIS